MLTDLSLSCKHSGTGPPREYTLTHTPHILFTPTIAFSSSHLAHASEQSKMVKLRRWPSIKSHARSIHASRWVVEDWTWIAVARYWSSNDVSPCFRESLVRNTICLVVVSTIYSPPDISLFSRSKGTGGQSCQWQVCEKSKQSSSLWLSLSDRGDLWAGSNTRWATGTINDSEATTAVKQLAFLFEHHSRHNGGKAGTKL